MTCEIMRDQTKGRTMATHGCDKFRSRHHVALPLVAYVCARASGDNMDAPLPLSAPPLLATGINEHVTSQSVTLRFRFAFNPLHQVIGRATQSWRGVLPLHLPLRYDSLPISSSVLVPLPSWESHAHVSCSRRRPSGKTSMRSRDCPVAVSPALLT